MGIFGFHFVQAQGIFTYYGKLSKVIDDKKNPIRIAQKLLNFCIRLVTVLKCTMRIYFILFDHISQYVLLTTSFIKTNLYYHIFSCKPTCLALPCLALPFVIVLVIVFTTSSSVPDISFGDFDLTR